MPLADLSPQDNLKILYSLYPKWQTKKKSLWREASNHSAQQYCFTAVLHGVKYLAEPRRSIFERFVWFLILLSFVGLCLHLVWTTSIADLSKPLMINLEASNEPIWNFEFPAVTICPNSKFNKSAAYKLADTLKLPSNITKEDFVKLVPNLLHLIDFAKTDEALLLDSILTANNVSVLEIYLTLSVQCSDLLLHCRLNGVSNICSRIFRTVRTADGICCAFNYAGISEKYHLSQEEDPNPIFESSLTGISSGLSVITNPQTDAYGTLMASHGVTVFIHGRRNYPDKLSIIRLVQSQHAERFAVVPIKISTNSKIRNFSHEIRNCYFEDEMPQQGFEEYSYKNCMFTCFGQLFRQMCKCLPFYYPSIDGVATCTLRDVPCLSKYKYAMKVHNVTKSLDCGCRPDCNEVSYEVATSSSFIETELIKQSNAIPTTGDYSEVNVFFKALYGIRYERVSHSTTYTLLAQFGGLMGLFMGFSFISVFELIYSFSLRIVFKVNLLKVEEEQNQPEPEPTAN